MAHTVYCMDSPPESVLVLSCEPPPSSPTLPSLDHSPLPLKSPSLSPFPHQDHNEEEDEEEEEEISIPSSPTPAVALFPGGQGVPSPSPESPRPEPPLDSVPPGFGALEQALSSTQDPSCSEELDLQLFHNGRPGREGGEGGAGEGAPSLKFPCKVCGKRFRFNSILSLHARAHMLERDRSSHACPHCHFRAPHRAGLAVHIKTHQNPALEAASSSPKATPAMTPPALSPLLLTGDAPPLTPPLTEEAAPYGSTPAEDSASFVSSSFRCHACKGKFRTASELSRHVRILHNPYKCTMCPFSASQEEALALHLQQCHPAEEPLVPVSAPTPPPLPAFRCEICGQRFTQSWFLKGHMRKHKDSLDHKCQVCGRGFKEPWFLKNHMKVHLNKLGLKVGGAGGGSSGGVTGDQSKTLPSSQAFSNLYSSLLLSRGGGGTGGSGARVGPSEAGEPSKTSLLGYLGLPGEGGASCMERLQAVAQVAERGGASAGGGAVGVAGQAAVWQLVARSLSQQQPSKPRSRPHKSSVAGEAEQVRAYLGGLLSRDEHAGTPWECPDCGKLFRTLQQAVAHARVHSQRPQKDESRKTATASGRGSEAGAETPKPPSVVGYQATQFPGENGLRSVSSAGATPRERIRGAGVKDCPYCGKAFRSSHHLKVHLRVHTGERPYKCPHCDYAGTQSGSLKYHLQRHHREQRSSSSGTVTALSPSQGAPPQGASGKAERTGRSGRDNPSSRHSQQWQGGALERRERKAAGPQRGGAGGLLGSLEGFHYPSRVIGGAYPGASVRGWVSAPPQAKIPKVSRRKPLSTSRLAPPSGRSGQDGFEPLDLSRRPPLGQGCEEDGGGVTLSQCLFCPFRTSSTELMAMHLQVNHTSKSRRKRVSAGDSRPHGQAPHPARHSDPDPLALWKSWRDNAPLADWATARMATANGFSQEEAGPKNGHSAEPPPGPVYECEEEEEEEEEERDGEMSTSSPGQEEGKILSLEKPLPPATKMCEEGRGDADDSDD